MSEQSCAVDLAPWMRPDWPQGLCVGELHDLDTLTVQTKNTTYEIIVIDPQTAEVLVRGGKFCPKYIPAQLSGASVGGSLLKRHSIYIGFAMELRTPDGPIVTSRVRKVTVAHSVVVAD